ncbi:hypothetical protein QT902_021145, partial [Xanthomonas campestris]|uniref:hypothetical protein n=1 Tax=Xanthomonas campestris TaxID=339 RepID=UPI00358D4FFD
FSVAERQLHGLLLNMRRVVSRIYGALFRGSQELEPPNFPGRVSVCGNHRFLKNGRKRKPHVRKTKNLFAPNLNTKSITS